ncbi:MAG TPA: hypothetical protein VGM29_02545 [Polyangiaceae bacterium]
MHSSQKYGRHPNVQLGHLPRIAHYLHALPAASALLVVSASAFAQPAALELAYQAPPECPPSSALSDAVSKLVKEQPSEPFRVRVAIASEGGKYVAHIAPSDGSERTLSGDTCAEVVEATSVVLALAINPKQDGPGAESELPTPPPEAKRAPAAGAGAQAPVVSPVAAPLRFLAGAALTGDLGTLPGFDVGLSARMGVVATWWSATADGSYFFPKNGTLENESSQGGSFSLWTIAASGCGAPHPGAVRFELCAGPEFGRIQGDALGVSYGQNTHGFWLALLGGPELTLALAGPLRLRLGVAAAVPVAGRHLFTLDGNRVHRPSSVALRSALGIDVVF